MDGPDREGIFTIRVALGDTALPRSGRSPVSRGAFQWKWGVAGGGCPAKRLRRLPLLKSYINEDLRRDEVIHVNALVKRLAQVLKKHGVSDKASDAALRDMVA